MYFIYLFTFTEKQKTKMGSFGAGVTGCHLIPLFENELKLIERAMEPPLYSFL